MSYNFKADWFKSYCDYYKTLGSVPVLYDQSNGRQTYRFMRREHVTETTNFVRINGVTLPEYKEKYR